MSEQVAIITAGGSGMGAAAARAAGKDGYRVAILSSSGKGEALADELGGIGVTGSNQSNDDLKRLVDLTMDAMGPRRCAGQQRRPRPARADPRDHRRAMAHGLDVYLLNVIRPTRLVAPIMVQQKAGAIVNISTAWAFEPSADVSDLGRVSRRARGLHQDFRRHLCRQTTCA